MLFNLSTTTNTYFLYNIRRIAPTDYLELLDNIKKTIQSERSQAIQKLTRSLIVLYWKIGKLIVNSQTTQGWGKSVVEQLAKDLNQEFPNKTVFSPRNLWSMRQFYDTYKDN